MENINEILALFDTPDKWNAFIELSNMRDKMVAELKTRLNKELQKIADSSSLNTKGWKCWFDDNSLTIKPINNSLIGITIEWNWWGYEWCRRGACLWVDAKSINSTAVSENIKKKKKLLPLQDYEENIENHTWFPFVKQIPSTVFNVDDNITTVEECLYMAKDNSSQLAKNIWEEVFKPFINKETADLMLDFVKQKSK